MYELQQSKSIHKALEKAKSKTTENEVKMKTQIIQENPYIVAIKSLSFLIVAMFFGSSIFDASITYYNYATDSQFIEKEANYLLGWGIEKGIPFWFNPAIIVNFTFIPIFLYFREKFILNPTGWRKHGFEFLIFLLLIGTSGHLYGGMSWIMGN